MGVRIGRQYALSWMKKAKNAEYRSRLQAFTYYGEAAKRDPEFAQPWYEKGKLARRYSNLENDSDKEELLKGAPPEYSGSHDAYDLAEACFEKALEIEPNSIDALFEKGKFHSSYVGIGVREDTLTCLNKVLELDSKHVDALEIKIKVLEDMQKFEESLECIDQIIKINRKKSGSLSLAWNILHKANILYELGKFKDSLKWFDKAISANKSLEDEKYTLNRKGLILTKLERYGDALDCFDESKESLKDGRPPLSEITVEAHFCRALCLQETCADKKEVFNSYYSAIYAAKYRVTEYVGTPYDWKVLKNGLAQFSEFCNRKYHQYR